MPDGGMVEVVVRHILFGNNFHRAFGDMEMVLRWGGGRSDIYDDAICIRMSIGDFIIKP